MFIAHSPPELVVPVLVVHELVVPVLVVLFVGSIFLLRDLYVPSHIPGRSHVPACVYLRHVSSFTFLRNLSCTVATLRGLISISVMALTWSGNVSYSLNNSLSLLNATVINSIFIRSLPFGYPGFGQFFTGTRTFPTIKSPSGVFLGELGQYTSSNPLSMISLLM